jgi:hypothetical protein
MEEIYCLKCKKRTNTVDLINVLTKNNRKMLKGKCAVCGTIKNKFIVNTASTLKGGGTIVTGANLNSMINKLPFELHLPGHNFTGPGTDLTKRLNPDLTPKDNSKPINRVDAASMAHDICYLKNKDTKTRNEVCDKQMLENLNIYNPTIRERIDKAIVWPIIRGKMALGMGTKSLKC